MKNARICLLLVAIFLTIGSIYIHFLLGATRELEIQRDQLASLSQTTSDVSKEKGRHAQFLPRLSLVSAPSEEAEGILRKLWEEEKETDEGGLASSFYECLEGNASACSGETLEIADILHIRGILASNPCAFQVGDFFLRAKGGHYLQMKMLLVFLNESDVQKSAQIWDTIIQYTGASCGCEGVASGDSTEASFISFGVYCRPLLDTLASVQNRTFLNENELLLIKTIVSDLAIIQSAESARLKLLAEANAVMGSNGYNTNFPHLQAQGDFIRPLLYSFLGQSLSYEIKPRKRKF